MNPLRSGSGFERLYYRVAAAAILVFWLLFDKDVAGLYGLMLLIDFMYQVLDLHVSFPLAARNGAQAVLEGLGALVVFFAVSSVVVKAVDPAQSVVDLWTAGTPVLANNVVLTYAGFGVTFALIETSFVARLLDALDGAFGPLAWKLVVGVVLALLFVAGFMTFLHFQSKSLMTKPLLMTFLFFLLTAALIVRHQSWAGAGVLHVANNTLAVAVTFGHLAL